MDPDVAGETARLIDFLHERDVECPLCGYNLRNLTGSVCPECREELVLTVGIRKLRFGWLLVAVAPGIFSGIAALLLALPIIIVPLTGGGPAPWLVIGVDGFGWTSGITALVLLHRRYSFLQLSMATQRFVALGIWLIHLGAFVGVLAIARS